ncbi:hypothetical protein C8R46DRAFT_1000498 [Mycena filopes]|nr:hypothetical protein C8R46DRAFT_1000498 [Mycena filopes]
MDVDGDADDGEGDDGEGGAEEGKKHVCPTCAKRFNRPSSLRIHLNTHTGATPFRCPHPACGRAFNVNSNMRRHLRNHAGSAFAVGASPVSPTSQPSQSQSPSPTSPPWSDAAPPTPRSPPPQAHWPAPLGTQRRRGAATPRATCAARCTRNRLAPGPCFIHSSIHS